jgi:hypothetical protein
MGRDRRGSTQGAAVHAKIQMERTNESWFICCLDNGRRSRLSDGLFHIEDSLNRKAAIFRGKSFADEQQRSSSRVRGQYG